MAGEAAREQARGLAVSSLFQAACASEQHRRVLFEQGAHEVVVRAFARHGRWGERMHALSGTLAHLSTSAREQESLLTGGVVADLVDMYEDALVSGLDATSHRLRREVSITLSNIAHGPPGQRQQVVELGSEDAISEALSGCDGLGSLSDDQLVSAMRAAPHNAVLQLEATRQMRVRLTAAEAASARPQVAAGMVAVGAVAVVAAALRRHADSWPVAEEALHVVAGLCRWQPRAALLLRHALGVGVALGRLRAAMEHQLAPLAWAAAEALHRVAVAQVLLGSAVGSAALLDTIEAAPDLLELASRCPTVAVGGIEGSGHGEAVCAVVTKVSEGADGSDG